MWLRRAFLLLVLHWLWGSFRFHVLRRGRFPYSPFRPAEKGGSGDTGTGNIATVEQDLAFMQAQHDSSSTAWNNLCEKLQRTGYSLPAMYESAEKHGKAIPSGYKHGQETPSAGDIGLYLNGGYGHIVVFTGNGWECWTNDYTGKGKVGLSDGKTMASWCHATSWFVADAWWSSTYFRLTHDTPAPPPPPPGGGSAAQMGTLMFVAEVKYGSNNTSYWLVGPVGASGEGTTSIGGDEAASWTGPRMKVNDEATWRNILSRYPQ